MDDPTACWHRYLVTISALEPDEDEDEATQALIEARPVAARGWPSAGRVHNQRDQRSRGAALVRRLAGRAVRPVPMKAAWRFRGRRRFRLGGIKALSEVERFVRAVAG
jgi:hypothetical protein